MPNSPSLETETTAIGHGAPTQTGHLCLVSGNTALPSTPQMSPFHLPTSPSWRRVLMMDQPRPWKRGREGLASSPSSRGCGLSPTLLLSIIAMGGVKSHFHCLFWLEFERGLNPFVHSSAPSHWDMAVGPRPERLHCWSTAITSSLRCSLPRVLYMCCLPVGPLSPSQLPWGGDGGNAQAAV